MKLHSLQKTVLRLQLELELMQECEKRKARIMNEIAEEDRKLLSNKTKLMAYLFESKSHMEMRLAKLDLIQAKIEFWYYQTFFKLKNLSEI